MFPMPFGIFPYYRNNKNSSNSGFSNNESRTTANNEPFINFFGIDLFSDDILILCILLSLYLNGVKDEMLFISLILLLLS